MHDETLRELIDGGSAIVGSLAKEMLLHRNRMERLEAQREKDVEIAKARQRTRQEAMATQPADDTVMGVSAVPQEEVASAIDDLMADETCATCRNLLEALKDRPPREQVRGVMEYGEFKRDLSEGAGVEELKSSLRDTQVLKSIFEEDIRGRPV